MPQSTNPRRDLLRLVLFTLAAWGLWALGRNDAKPGAVSETDAVETRKRTGFSKRRLATSLAFATLFFAGAAFTAGAGDQAACLVDDCTPAVEADTTSTEATETEASEPAAEDPAAATGATPRSTFRRRRTTALRCPPAPGSPPPPACPARPAPRRA